MVHPEYGVMRHVAGALSGKLTERSDMDSSKKEAPGSRYSERSER